MNKGKRTYLEARVRLILPHILFLIFLLAYFYLSYKMVSPFIDSLPINRIENASAIIMQTTGILIGFTGASLYFFSGKMLEISEKVCEKAMSCVYLFSKCQMGYDFVFVELATARSRIKTKSDEKGLQEIESELKKARQESQHFLSEAEKMSKEIKKLLPQRSKLSFLLTILAFIILVLSLVSAFLFLLSGTLNYFKSSVDFLMLGIGCLVYALAMHYDGIIDMMSILNDYLSLNHQLVIVYTRLKEGRIALRNLI